MEWISTAEGDAGNVILFEFCHDFFMGRIIEGNAALNIPGNWILTLGTVMGAASYPEYHP
jgi:hypothetical protein